MEITGLQGDAPGRIVATVSHLMSVRQFPTTVTAHSAGGWNIVRTNGEFGPRCHAVSTAILLEAGEVFAAN